MNYQIGSAGRVVVIRYDDGEDILRGLEVIAKKENIRSAVIYLIGGMRRGRIVVGPRKDELPPEPLWRQIGEPSEVIALGTLFYEGEEPRVHLHGAFGREDSTKTGCLRELAETFLVAEAVVIEIKGVNAVREFDPKTGLRLLKL